MSQRRTPEPEPDGIETYAVEEIYPLGTDGRCDFNFHNMGGPRGMGILDTQSRLNRVSYSDYTSATNAVPTRGPVSASPTETGLFQNLSAFFSAYTPTTTTTVRWNVYMDPGSFTHNMTNMGLDGFDRIPQGEDITSPVTTTTTWQATPGAGGTTGTVTLRGAWWDINLTVGPQMYMYWKDGAETPRRTHVGNKWLTSPTVSMWVDTPEGGDVSAEFATEWKSAGAVLRDANLTTATYAQD